MAKKLDTILVTGFGPFPGVPVNASGVLAERLAVAGGRSFPGYRFISAVFATEWSSTPGRLSRLHDTWRPRFALHFGVSERARGFVIETRADNLCRASADAAGLMPRAATLLDDAPGALPVTLPIERILERLHRLGMPVSLSDDAGGYLCNAVLFHGLSLGARDKAACATGFIHIPVSLANSREEGGLDWDTAIAGGLEIIAACLDQETSELC